MRITDVLAVPIHGHEAIVAEIVVEGVGRLSLDTAVDEHLPPRRILTIQLQGSDDAEDLIRGLRSCAAAIERAVRQQRAVVVAMGNGGNGHVAEVRP